MLENYKHLQNLVKSTAGHNLVVHGRDHIETFSWQDYDCQGWPSALVMGGMKYTVLCVCVCVWGGGGGGGGGGGAEIEECRIKIPVLSTCSVSCALSYTA